MKLDKPGGFIGRDAIAERRAAGPPAARLACLLLDDPRAVALGSEPVRRRRRAPRPGHQRRLRLRGRAQHRARLPAAGRDRVGTRLEVDIFGDWVGAEVAAEPLYDPQGARLRAWER